MMKKIIIICFVRFGLISNKNVCKVVGYSVEANCSLLTSGWAGIETITLQIKSSKPLVPCYCAPKLTMRETCIRHK